MRAVVYDKPGSFTVADRPMPEPGRGEVLLRVLVAGVCGTDVHLHDGEFGPTYPLTPGHEFVGEVVALGPDVASPAIGARVVVDNTAACGHCVECRRARPNFCRNLVAQGVNAPGGFAEYLTTDADRCFDIGDLDPFVAVFTEPTACVVHGLDVLAPAPGAHILIFGAGPTGIILAQLLARTGAGSVTVAAPSAHKLELIASRGADRTVRVDRSDLPGARDASLEALSQVTGRQIDPVAAGGLGGDGFDIVIDASGSADVLELAPSLVRVGGTIFVYGMTREGAVWPLRPYDVFRRELTVKGSFAQQFSFDRALDALRSGRVDTTGMITDRYGLDDYGAALAAVANSASIKTVLVPGA
ncbi:zinc-dependent alcohol dehydrogenase family protein [Gryllotalpicola reticulitermitis]|uniref:Zinc-dependent alcohol dehydrogenase family protein n=1 Tax=Gryllotalpicola reticulitermitis TaxID=1184153 RepID=A0ABV8Q3Y7_9MICO